MGIVGNTIPENMAAAEKRLEEHCEATIGSRNAGVGFTDIVELRHKISRFFKIFPLPFYNLQDVQ